MVNGEGLLLDDMAVPEIEYFTDFEQDDGGWQAEGFVRIQNLMPQTFRVSLVEKGQKTSVQPVFLLTDQTASIPINIGGNVQEVVLIISGTSRFTRQPAAYEISIDSQR
jgi:immune inhibitor A